MGGWVSGWVGGWVADWLAGRMGGVCGGMRMSETILHGWAAKNVFLQHSNG